MVKMILMVIGPMTLIGLASGTATGSATVPVRVFVDIVLMCLELVFSINDH